MFDQFTPRGRILGTALDCAAAKSWDAVTLLEIAEAAKVPLIDLRREFSSKTDILAALMRAVDDEVLKRAPKRSEGQTARDALFDIIMTRFDVLAPYKKALQSISASGPTDLGLARPVLSSMHWMLEAAGINTEGAGGSLRVTGLAALYASVFRTWLQDDDPGHARTMAALDRRLRRGESAIRNVEQVTSVMRRLATDGPAFMRSVFRGRPPPPQQPGQSSEAGLP
ncbi:MAG: TetR family transcriptional regulator [Hyphomicrobiaceae bacterium]|nr:TetR family transcriptional regulator [Hyphomicrobiaceae bacterium]